MADEPQADAAISSPTDTGSNEPASPQSGSQAAMPDFTNLEDYRATLNDALNAPDPEPTPEPKPVEPSATPTVPPAETEAQPATKADAETPDPDSLPERRRLRADGDPVKKLAFHLLDQNPKLGLAEAESLAKQSLGQTTSNPETGPAEPSETQDETADERIERMTQAWNEARANFDEEAEAKALAALTEAQVEKKLQEREEAQSAEQRTHEFAQAVNASKDRAHKAWPEAWTPGSELHQEIQSLTRQLNGSPLMEEPDFPEQIVKMALGRLGRPAVRQAPAPALAPDPSPPAPRPPIAPGGARTEAPPAPAMPPDFASEAEYNDWLSKNL